MNLYLVQYDFDVTPFGRKLGEIENIGEFIEVDKKLLETLITKFQGKPVGIESLATTLGEDAETIEDVYEPYLMQVGFLSRTPRGRMVTPAGYAHLGLTMPGQQRMDV